MIWIAIVAYPLFGLLALHISVRNGFVEEEGAPIAFIVLAFWPLAAFMWITFRVFDWIDGIAGPAVTRFFDWWHSYGRDPK